jgi:diguanylate cyclase (GGDEF)-like protein
MSISSNYSEEAIVGRESLFRRKLTQLRTTGEIKRVSANNNHAGFKEIEQTIYVNNINSNWAHSDPRQLEKLALLDSLTELYNHDTINRMLKDELKRALRYKKELSLLVITLDCLAQATNCSNSACDSILKKTAQSVMQIVRDVDIPGRFDREHFFIVCPETGEAGAASLAKRLCHRVGAEQNFDINPQWDTTVSIGVVTFPTPAQNDQQMLNLGFQALRSALKSGGNTFTLAR